MGNLPEVNKFYLGNVLDTLKTWPDNFIHTAMTSPPYYSLRDYGKDTHTVWDGDEKCQHDFEEYIRPGKQGGNTEISQYSRYDKTIHGFCKKCHAWKGQLGLEPTPEMYIDHLVQIFRELRRCLRPDGTFWLNLGDSYAGGGKGWNAQVDSSFQRTWCEPETFNGGMKPPTYITGKQENGIKPKDMIGIPWATAFAMRTDGWYLRSEIIWHSPDKCPESAKDRPTRNHEQVFLFSKSRSYFYDMDAIREPIKDARVQAEYPLGKNRRTVWTINAEPAVQYGPQTRVPSAIVHHASFPEALVAPTILAGTSEKGCCPDCGTPWDRVVSREAKAETNGVVNKEWDDNDPVPEAEVPQFTMGWKQGCSCPPADPIPCLVFDPFMGSGTVALVARKNGRSFLGTEANPIYLDLAERRIGFVRDQVTL